MAIVNRASLPEEFFDITSAQVLVQPEPQFLYARLAKMSIGAAMALSMAGGLGLPGRQIPDAGAQYTQPGADRLILANPEPMMAQAVMTVAELGQQVGHTVRLNRPKFGSGGFTAASREVSSGTAISTTAIDLSSEQTSVTLKRYGGPFDPVAGAVAPFALDRFDASRSVHSIAQVVGTHMQRDFDKWLDAVIVALYNLGATTLWPQGYSADNGSSVAGDMPMDIDLIFRGIETLKIGNIPVFPNGKYRAVLSPTQARQIKSDPQAAQYIRYDSGANPVLGSSYLGSVAGCDIFEATTLSATANTNSVNVTTAHMFGPGAVGQGWGQLPMVRPSTDDNYGETAKLVWLAYAGFAMLDNRMVVQLHTS
jgi:N4-gp56 family major capsid protein